MKLIIASLIVLIHSAFAAPTIIPKCIQKMIDTNLAEPVWTSATEITKYFYRNKTVYLSISSCCDQLNPLYDESCNYICAPSGGFSGRGNEQCTDFIETAVLLGSVWTYPGTPHK